MNTKGKNNDSNHWYYLSLETNEETMEGNFLINVPLKKKKKTMFQFVHELSTTYRQMVDMASI